MTLPEKMELIFRAYSKSFDYAMSCRKVGISDEERELIDKDEAFQSRLMMLDIEVQEELIMAMRTLARSETESIRLRATEQLGKMLYADRFREIKDSSKDVQKHDITVNLVGVHND